LRRATRRAIPSRVDSPHHLRRDRRPRQRPSVGHPIPHLRTTGDSAMIIEHIFIQVKSTTVIVKGEIHKRLHILPFYISSLLYLAEFGTHSELVALGFFVTEFFEARIEDKRE